MNKKLLFINIFLLSLTSCNNSNMNSENMNKNKQYVVNYLLNSKAEEIKLNSGYEAIGDNLLYAQQLIESGNKLIKPENDPIREGYVFDGWCLDKEGNNKWNFEEDVVLKNTFLYAKWGIKQEDVYVEPPYIINEQFIEDESFKLNGILNIPVNNMEVGLTLGAINRLIFNKDDVNFALNYSRKENVTFSSKFDEANMMININYVDNNESNNLNIKVNNVSSSYALTSYPYYENKAINYEKNGSEYENYHILLGGSSSMENWSSSKKDLDPIVSYNHGIGGTTVEQWRDFLARRLIYPYSPKCVVLYVGVNNIINSHDSGETTGQYCLDLFDDIHKHLPNTKIFYVLINKLPGYLNYQPQFDICNSMCKQYEEEHDYLSCINAGEVLLKENGLPNESYFLTDGLHMSKYGYVKWGNVIKNALIEWMKNE